MSRNAISANPEHYIFNIFWGSKPLEPPRRPKKFLLADAWLKNFFSGSTPPPKQKILDRTLLEVITMKFLTNAPITFIINHPPRKMTQNGKPSHQDSHCVQKRPPPQDKTGSQKPHPQDIKLGNITGVFINSLTLVAFCLNKYNYFSMGILIIVIKIINVR